MSISDPEHVQIRSFLKKQRQERYHAFVIHGQPLKGKTAFARKLAETTPHGEYLNVLKYVADHADLAKQVDVLDTVMVRDIILAYAKEARAKLLLVDEIDFLIPTWGGDLTEFKHMVKSLSVSVTPTVIGFFLQTRHEIEEWVLVGTFQQNRILQIENIAAL